MIRTPIGEATHSMSERTIAGESCMITFRLKNKKKRKTNNNKKKKKKNPYGKNVEQHTKE